MTFLCIGAPKLALRLVGLAAGVFLLKTIPLFANTTVFMFMNILCIFGNYCIQYTIYNELYMLYIRESSRIPCPPRPRVWSLPGPNGAGGPPRGPNGAGVPPSPRGAGGPSPMFP